MLEFLGVKFMFDWDNFDKSIGHDLISNEDGKVLEIAAPTVSGLTLVKENNGSYETFYEIKNIDELVLKGIHDHDEIWNHLLNTNFVSKRKDSPLDLRKNISKTWDEKFPVGTFLAYGREAAIAVKSNQGEEVVMGIYDMRNHEFVENESFSIKSLMANGNPYLNYNREALFTLCDDPSKLADFFKQNGSPKTNEAKLMFYDLANRVINLMSNNNLKEIHSALHNEESPANEKQ